MLWATGLAGSGARWVWPVGQKWCDRSFRGAVKDGGKVGQLARTFSLVIDSPVVRFTAALDRLEEVHVQTQRFVKVPHGLPGDLARVTVVTDETPLD